MSHFLLPLLDLISFAKIQFMQRFVQKTLPVSFKDTWAYNSIRNIGVNEIQLRNHFEIQPQHSIWAKLDIFPFYNFPKLWHIFPDEQIKIIRKISEFDKKTLILLHKGSLKFCRLWSTHVPCLHGGSHMKCWLKFLNHGRISSYLLLVDGRSARVVVPGPLLS